MSEASLKKGDSRLKEITVIAKRLPETSAQRLSTRSNLFACQSKNGAQEEITEIFYYSITEHLINQLFSVVRKANPLNRFNRPQGLLNYEFSVFSCATSFCKRFAVTVV